MNQKLIIQFPCSYGAGFTSVFFSLLSSAFTYLPLIYRTKSIIFLLQYLLKAFLGFPCLLQNGYTIAFEAPSIITDSITRVKQQRRTDNIKVRFWSSESDTEISIRGIVSQKSRLKFKKPARKLDFSLSLSNQGKRFLKKEIVTWCNNIESYTVNIKSICNYYWKVGDHQTDLKLLSSIITRDNVFFQMFIIYFCCLTSQILLFAYLMNSDCSLFKILHLVNCRHFKQYNNV